METTAILVAQIAVMDYIEFEKEIFTRVPAYQKDVENKAVLQHGNMGNQGGTENLRKTPIYFLSTHWKRRTDNTTRISGERLIRIVNQRGTR